MPSVSCCCRSAPIYKWPLSSVFPLARKETKKRGEKVLGIPQSPVASPQASFSFLCPYPCRHTTPNTHIFIFLFLFCLAPSIMDRLLLLFGLLSSCHVAHSQKLAPGSLISSGSPPRMDDDAKCSWVSDWCAFGWVILNPVSIGLNLGSGF